MTTATAASTPAAGTPLDELKARKVELVLQQLDTLPTLPAIALQLLALTGDSESKIEEVTRLVSSDPALTGKVLSLANSAASGPLQSRSSPANSGGAGITNLQHAVVLLGWDALRNLALSVKVFEIFQAAQPPASPAKSNNTDGAFSISELWKHSLAVATMAELLAPKCTPRQSPSEAFVCGLLHDLGKIAFDAAMPKSFARVVEAASLSRADIADIERRVIGLDHALAGKRVAESWNLPPVITESIWLHGAPPLAPAAPNPAAAGIARPHMVLLIGLADLLVRRQHLGFSGNFLFPYDAESYAAPLHLSPDHLATAIASLHSALEARSRAIGMADVESRALYLESIANANLELGRANQLMTIQNRKLAARSMCFELMTAFYSRVSPAASPAQLLGEIALASHAFFNSSRLVLFSQDPAASSDTADPDASPDTLGEVLFFEAGHGAQDSFLMPMPPWAGDQRIATSAAAGRVGQFFTRPASPQLDWILDKAQTFLGTRDAWFMPLLAGAQPVGGILWIKQPADAGNAMSQIPDLPLVAQAWGSSLRTAQIRERQSLLAETLAAANRELGALQQQLVRARSLASVGEMAAGAAHEMNNPLAIICGRAQLLAAKLSDAPLRSDASLIAAQGERLSGIITDMMEFARPPAPRPSLTTVADIASAAVASAADRFGVPPDTLTVDLTPNLPPLLVDPRQIKQALAEILLNALQATKAAEARDPASLRPVRLEARFDTMNRTLLFRVIDTGIGMTPDILNHAFSPFYSAKPAGRNRGMGLAKALRWVENHNGTIRLDSLPNTGTTTILLLPIAPD